MPWTRFALATAVLAAAVPALADVVVIRASGPSAARYKAGTSLPDATRLVLKQGDRLVLLDAQGTRTVSGPGSFPARGAGNAAAPSLLALASNTADRRNRVGAVRDVSFGQPKMRPNIFLVDVTSPGPMCIADATGVTLWRRASDAAGTSTIVAADGRTVALQWIKGQSTQAWPATLPVTSGSSYRLTLAQAGAAAPVAITFQLLAAPPADLPQLAKELIAHGCSAQVNVVIATTGAAAG